MPSKMFLKLDGVPGDSKEPRHIGEIEITAWSWGGSQFQQTLILGAAQGELVKNMKSDLTVTKMTDRTSQNLIEACASGRQFAEAILTIETISETGNLLKAMLIKLKVVNITSVASCASLETVSLSFEKMEIGYTEAAN